MTNKFNINSNSPFNANNGAETVNIDSYCTGMGDLGAMNPYEETVPANYGFSQAFTTTSNTIDMGASSNCMPFQKQIQATNNMIVDLGTGGCVSPYLQNNSNNNNAVLNSRPSPIFKILSA